MIAGSLETIYCEAMLISGTGFEILWSLKNRNDSPLPHQVY
jgi:hypothetical protein